MQNHDSGPGGRPDGDSGVLWLAQAAPSEPAAPPVPAAPPEPPAPDLGFRLPGIGGPAPAPRKTPAPLAAPAPPASQLEVQPPAPVSDTSVRDLAIGGAVFVALMVAFFFARNAYTQHLVVRRVAPSAAGSAGWLLFAGLSLVSAAALLALINAGKYLRFAIAGPLLLVGIAGLVGALLVGRR